MLNIDDYYTNLRKVNIPSYNSEQEIIIVVRHINNEWMETVIFTSIFYLYS